MDKLNQAKELVELSKAINPSPAKKQKERE